MKKALPYRAPNWKTAPISPTCEHIGKSLSGIHFICGQPTEYCYPAMGQGWMALCGGHGKKHLPHAFTIEDLIQAGEKLDGAPMDATDLHIICECCAILTDEEMCIGYEVNGKPSCENCWQAAADENP